MVDSICTDEGGRRQCAALIGGLAEVTAGGAPAIKPVNPSDDSRLCRDLLPFFLPSFPPPGGLGGYAAGRAIR
jgi:hypothetical protein